MNKPEIGLTKLLELEELVAVVVELGDRWDGVVSGKISYENKILNFLWVEDEDVKDDLKEGRDYVVYDDSGRIGGRITESLVNSFRSSKTEIVGGKEREYLAWELKGSLTAAQQGAAPDRPQLGGFSSVVALRSTWSRFGGRRVSLVVRPVRAAWSRVLQ